MDSVDQLQMLHEAVKLWVIMDRIEKNTDIPEVCSVMVYVLHRVKLCTRVHSVLEKFLKMLEF